MKPLDKAFLWKTSFLIYLFNIVFAELSVKPQNTLTRFGNETSLKCCSKQSNYVLEWKFLKWKNGDLFIKICSGQTCHRGEYSIDSSIPGCSSLIINSSSSDVAGLYQCNEVETGDVGGAFLVVYQFNCQHNFSSKGDLVEGHKVVFHCTALWKGKLPFQFTWKTADGKLIRNTSFPEYQEFYGSTMPVDISRPRLPSYTFSIHFTSNVITDEHVDRHSPVVSWSSSEQQVMYPVSNIRTNCPNKDCEKKKGDIVNCSADGFPVPVFQWLDWDLKLVASSSILQMESVGSFEHTCISKNTIHGQEYKVQEKIVVRVIEKTEGMSQSAIVGIVVGAILIFIVIVILVLVSFITRTVLRIADVYFNENENTCRRSESGTRISKPDDIPLDIYVQPEGDDHRDNEPHKVNKDPKESEKLLPVRQVDDADVDLINVEAGIC